MPLAQSAPLPAELPLAQLLPANGGDGTKCFVSTGEGGQAGFPVSGAGDVNGDGFDDFMIGAPSALSNRGEAYIVFFQPPGPSGLPNICGARPLKGS
jgi:hypothetical protein